MPTTTARLAIADPFWVQVFHHVVEDQPQIDVLREGSDVPADKVEEIIANAATHDVTIVQVVDAPTDAPTS